MIRQATKDDIPACLRMGREFTTAAGFEPDESSMQQTLSMLVDCGGLFVAGTPAHGMAAVLIYENYFNRAQLAAQELFWWVDREARGSGAGRELIVALEAHAREKGAHTLTMLALDELDGERVARMYVAAGYRPLERNFVKVL